MNGWTRVGRPNTWGSTATTSVDSLPRAPSRLSRRAQAASSISGGRTSTRGGVQARVQLCRCGVVAMGESKAVPRRMRIERGIYRRPTGVLEVGFRDEGGLQRWRTVHGGILAARRLRDELSARRARGESVAPSPRLRFGEAAERWLSGPVLALRDTTQVKYQSVVKEHLWPRFATRRLDGITADDLALLVREMRAATRGEATIAVVLAVVGRIYKFAVRRLGWNGTIPTTLMLSSERPKI